MPGLFIDVKIDEKVAGDAALARKLCDVCPVNIFAQGKKGLEIVEENLDECVLCDLCLEVAAQGGLTIVKLYE